MYIKKEHICVCDPIPDTSHEGRTQFLQHGTIKSLEISELITRTGLLFLFL